MLPEVLKLLKVSKLEVPGLGLLGAEDDGHFRNDVLQPLADQTEIVYVLEIESVDDHGHDLWRKRGQEHLWLVTDHNALDNPVFPCTLSCLQH